ncbi:MAG: ABC transporter permease [Atribacterota bacterium]
MRRNFISRRVVQAGVVVLGVTLVAFGLQEVMPGDPVELLLQKEGLFHPTPEEIAVFRAQLGFDQPLPVRYVRWMQQVFRGDFGRSYVSRRPVIMEIRERLPATLLLSMVTLLFSLLVGLFGGVILAVYAGGVLDHLGRIFSFLLRSLPTFFLGTMLMVLFAERWRIFPTSGMGSWRHLVLPALVGGSGFSVVVMRLLRAHLLQALGSDYVLAARSRGLSLFWVTLKHAFPNSFVTVLSLLGLYLGGIFGGAPIVETIFAWPGVGRLLITSISDRDFPVIQAFVLILGLAYVGFQALIDWFYFFLDPRVDSDGE